MIKVLKYTLILAVYLLAVAYVPSVGAQMSGEELPPGVTADEVYAVSSKMYCEVCAGVPLSDCPSVTCRAWRQEIATLLGEGYTADEIKQSFAENYGGAVTGVPLKDSDRNLGFGLPAALILGAGLLIVGRLWMLRQKGETRALQAARAAGLNPDYDRPVPDNVDAEYLERFMRLVEERQ